MDFHSSFRVQASLTAVSAFHRQSASMRAVTPPPVIVRMHQAPETLAEGDQVDFTMWMGPLPVRWLAHIEHVNPEGFDDRQVSGPFYSWVHHHIFVSIDEQTTEINDWVQAELHPALFWKLVGAFMWLNMPFLFAFRSWKTRRLLQK